MSPVGDDIRVALLGFGQAGRWIHAPLIEAVDGMRVATVVTSDDGRADEARSLMPGVRVESSAEAVWERADEHDLVVISTANVAHVPLASACIDAGLPVVVDKPLAPSANEARALVDRAEAAGVPLTVFQNRRWDADFVEARRLVDSGELGGIWRFESRFERWRPEAPEGAWRFEVPREEGGGVLLDLGAHLVDQALQLFGPAADVHGEVRALRGGPADDDAFLVIRHESGVISHLWMSEVAREPGPRMRLIGSGGAWTAQELDEQEATLRSARAPSPVAGWAHFYAGVAAALQGEARMPVDPCDAVSVLDVLEQADAI